jgi:transcriptional regulator with XRE-family HTH domain
MMLTGEQLRAIRGERTREQFAAELGDCSASTLNKWERNISPVPQWVAEKALRKVPLTLPIDAMALLIDYSRETNQPFEKVLTTAIHHYLAANTNVTEVGPAPVGKGSPTVYQQTARIPSGAAVTVLAETEASYSTAKTAPRKAAG